MNSLQNEIITSMSTKHYTHGTALTEGAWLTPLPALLMVRFCDKLLHTTGKSVSPSQSHLASCTVTQNWHVLLEMCLVHFDTQWTRVVRDVSLEFYCCLPKILFPTDLRGDFLVADSARWAMGVVFWLPKQCCRVWSVAGSCIISCLKGYP